MRGIELLTVGSVLMLKSRKKDSEEGGSHKKLQLLQTALIAGKTAFGKASAFRVQAPSSGK